MLKDLYSSFSTLKGSLLSCTKMLLIPCVLLDALDRHGQVLEAGILVETLALVAYNTVGRLVWRTRITRHLVCHTWSNTRNTRFRRIQHSCLFVGEYAGALGIRLDRTDFLACHRPPSSHVPGLSPHRYPRNKQLRNVLFSLCCRLSPPSRGHGSISACFGGAPCAR